MAGLFAFPNLQAQAADSFDVLTQFLKRLVEIVRHNQQALQLTTARIPRDWRSWTSRSWRQRDQSKCPAVLGNLDGLTLASCIQ